MQSQDEIMQDIVNLVKEGAGGTLTPQEESFLRDRYYRWIVTPKKVEEKETTPQQIWDTDAGKKMRERIREIGKLLATKKNMKAVLDKGDYVDVCKTVELLSPAPCPHCPGEDWTG